MRVGGNPHFSHFTGSTHHSSAGSTGNRTGCYQGVRWSGATCYLMHARFRRSGLAGPLAVGLGESDDDGERGCRKSDVAGGQGGHWSILRGAAPACDPYREPTFLDDVLKCFRIVSLGIPSALRLIGEGFPEQCDRAGTGIGGCVAVCRYLLAAGIVKAVAGARVKLQRDVAAKCPAALDKSPAEPG